MGASISCTYVASLLQCSELLRGRTTCSSINTSPLSLVPQARVLWCLQSVLEHLFCTWCETAVPTIIIWKALSLESRNQGQTCPVVLLYLPSANRGCYKFSLSVLLKCALSTSYLEVLPGLTSSGLGVSFLPVVNKALIGSIFNLSKLTVIFIVLYTQHKVSVIIIKVLTVTNSLM